MNNLKTEKVIPNVSWRNLKIQKMNRYVENTAGNKKVRTQFFIVKDYEAAVTIDVNV